MPLPDRQHGFTLIELVAVIVLIGILSFAAFARLPERAQISAQGFGEQVAATLRYAQRAAVAQRRAVYVNVDPAARSVSVCADAAQPCAQPLAAPGGGALAVSGPPGITLASTPAQIAFDALGQPTPATGAQLQISGGGSTVSVLVEAGTGYVRRL